MTAVSQVEPTPNLFRSAARVVRERGLTRGEFEDWEGAVCILGACGIAAGFRSIDGGYMYRVVDFLSDLLSADATPFIQITTWNDRAAKDAEEVAQFLERAAEAAS